MRQGNESESERANKVYKTFGSKKIKSYSSKGVNV